MRIALARLAPVIGAAIGAVLAAAVVPVAGASAVPGSPTAHARSSVVDHDRVGDTTDVDRQGVRNHPRRRGEADFVRTTYALHGQGRHRSLEITYVMGAVLRRSPQITVQLGSGLGLGNAEYEVSTSYGGRYDWGTTVYQDRTPICRHARIPLDIEPRRATIRLRLPAACLPGKPGTVLSGAYDDSYVFGPGPHAELGQDESHADWKLRLR